MSFALSATTSKTKEQPSKKQAAWCKTRGSNLYEHVHSGRYYAVAWVNGKHVFRSLVSIALSMPSPSCRRFWKIQKASRKDRALRADSTIEDLASAYLDRVPVFSRQ